MRALLFIGLVLTLPVLAQPHDRADGYIGLRAGFIELEDVDEDGSYNLGVFGGFFLTPELSLEASYDFQTSEVVLYEDCCSTVVVPLLDRKTNAFQLGLKFSPFRTMLRPYLMGGVGYYSSEYTLPDYFGDVDRIGDTGYYGGLGLELFGRAFADTGFTLVWENRWLFTQEEYWDENRIESDGFTSTLGFKFKF
ncbi:MAG: outer membrane beta-barrel protein [Acidobacteriota bacterium]|nr:outer membrane beta-barrel protein [Acidobacteriota bacterium]